ncbi:MAG: metalloregulator ArsR/SmtB family transcription factor [Pseudoalteromonas sp.]|uniref:metalloregulator ArsR/SmtB family transcription factor n=2 Tax=Pseudoalteromonas TaxID=53246 RepID=UPI003F9D961A
MNYLDPIQFFKCLADETRLKTLLLVLQEQELCVCELVAALSLSQPKVSRHLAQLRNCELLTDRRQGQWVFYRLNDALPRWATEVIEKTALNNNDFLNDSITLLNEMGDRPTRATICCEGSINT